MNGLTRGWKRSIGREYLTAVVFEACVGLVRTDPDGIRPYSYRRDLAVAAGGREGGLVIRRDFNANVGRIIINQQAHSGCFFFGCFSNTQQLDTTII